MRENSRFRSFIAAPPDPIQSSFTARSARFTEGKHSKEKKWRASLSAPAPDSGQERPWSQFPGCLARGQRKHPTTARRKAVHLKKRHFHIVIPYETAELTSQYVEKA